MKKTIIAMFLVAACGLCPAGRTINLKDGGSVTGNILAEKDKEVIVDLGFTVLMIPRDRIALAADANAEMTPLTVAAVPEANMPPAQKTAILPQLSQFELFHTGNNARSSIEDCVERFSEAVVMVSTPAGLGSGFFIDEDGFLITNYHVIDQETRIEVTIFVKTRTGFEKKTFKRVRIDALNPFVDLALLKVEDMDGYKPKFVNLGSNDTLKVGETVFAIGNPLGLERTTTSGIVSSKNRGFEGLVYLQTNADINPGNSGGPLFNLAGEVVGVTNMGYIFFGGLGFAIPVDYVKQFLNNRDAFAYDKDSPNTGFRYIQPSRRLKRNNPDLSAARK
jgi:serine protease Do